MSSSIFGTTGGLAGMLGDYNSIKNGSYGRLLKQYYGSSSTSSSRSGSTQTSNVLDRILEERKHPVVSAEVNQANSRLSSSVGSLKNALGTLQTKSTYEDTEGGSSARDKMTNALKSYVSSYNDAVESSKKTTMSNVSSNIAGMMKATEANKETLKQIGITINHDGTINLDEKKLQTAEFDKIKDIFSGDAAMSYGSAVASRLNRASVYTSNTSNTTATDSTSVQAATTSNSTSLLSSIDNITSDKLFSKTTDDKGNSRYNTDGILAEAQNFVKYYNATLSSAKNSSVSGVSANLASMMNKTANNSAALLQIGVSIGSDGKLSINKDTFSGADMEKVKDTFLKYGASIRSNASLLNYYSGTQNNGKNTYSQTGTYTSASDLVSSMYDTTG